MSSVMKERMLWSQESRIKLINLWENSLQYGYRIFEETEMSLQGVSLGIDQQLKESALAVSDNIAKGTNAVDKREFKKALVTSMQSLEEVVTNLYLANRWKYLSDAKFKELYEMSKTLMGKLKLLQ